MTHPLTTELTIEEIVENFEVLDDWDDRYSYLIELGRLLKPMAEDEQNANTKVEGCVSQVWVTHSLDETGDQKVLHFRGTSDAHIVRGLVAISLTLLSGRSPAEIAGIDAEKTFTQIGLQDHLSMQRANGLRAMVKRLKEIAAAHMQ